MSMGIIQSPDTRGGPRSSRAGKGIGKGFRHCWLVAQLTWEGITCFGSHTQPGELLWDDGRDCVCLKVWVLPLPAVITKQKLLAMGWTSPGKSTERKQHLTGKLGSTFGPGCASALLWTISDRLWAEEGALLAADGSGGTSVSESADEKILDRQVEQGVGVEQGWGTDVSQLLCTATEAGG